MSELTLTELKAYEKVVRALFDRLNISYRGVCGDYYMGNAYLYDGGSNGKPVALAITAQLHPSSISLSGVLDVVGIRVLGPNGSLGERKFTFDDLFGLYMHTADKPEPFYIQRRLGWNHTPDAEQLGRGISILNQYIDMFRACYGS